MREASHEAPITGHRAGSCLGHMTGKSRKKETGKLVREEEPSINRKQAMSSLPLKSQVATCGGPQDSFPDRRQETQALPPLVQLNPGKQLDSSDENDRPPVPSRGGSGGG